MLGSALDKAIGTLFPKWGASRAIFRNQLQKVSADTSDHQMMRKLTQSRSGGGYEAGKQNRLTSRMRGSAHENDLPREQITTMRVRSWNLYRNNPQARKICRTLGAKVVGRGLSPQPQTTTKDGAPHVEFRKRARQIWDEFCKEADYRGKPGRGGQPFPVMAKTALRQITLSGGVFFKFHHLSTGEQKKKNLLAPLQIQLVHVDRLDEQKNGDNQFYGVQVDDEGLPSGFWITKGGPKKQTAKVESVKVDADKMGHLFLEEDIDQILGSPWFGAALLTMDDRRNYEYSELIAAEQAACVVAGYRRSNGQSQLGLSNPNEPDRPLTDGNGNAITYLQPGMFLDLGKTGEIQMVSSNRPNNGAGDFIAHLVRSEAVAVPGVKSSTLTADYRNSSFSSERSADNDVWPEIEEIQDWFAMGFCQPIYEELITTAVLAGLFANVAGFTAEDFKERKREYLKTNWQGPVARSINPKDDAAAARMRVQNLTSTVQRECSKEACDWRENIDAVAEYIAYCKERGIPEDIYMQALGVEQKDEAEAPAGGSEAAQDAALHSRLHLYNLAPVGAQ